MLIRRRQILFFILYALILFYIDIQYFSSSLTSIKYIEDQSIYDLILKPQKLFFNFSVSFSIFIYISRKSFFSIELMVRYNRKLFTNVILHGLELVALYVFLIFFTLIITSVYYKLQFRCDLLQSILIMLLLANMFYHIYIFVYCSTNRHFWGVASIVIISFAILLIYIALYMSHFSALILTEKIYNCLNLFLFNLVLVITNYVFLKRKEVL